MRERGDRDTQTEKREGEWRVETVRQRRERGETETHRKTKTDRDTKTDRQTDRQRNFTEGDLGTRGGGVEGMSLLGTCICVD